MRQHWNDSVAAPLGHLGERTRALLIVHATDGIVVFYMRNTTSPYPLKDGSSCLVDYSDHHTLDQVCQTVSMKLLKVTGVTDDPCNPLSDTLPDLGPVGNLELHYHTDVRALIKAGSKIKLTGLAVSPLVDCSSGTVSRVTPYHCTLWSPLVTTPDGAKLRMYEWTRADLFWLDEATPLRSNEALIKGETDATTMRWAFKGDMPRQPAGIVRRMEDFHEELLALLGDPNVVEEELHQLLNRSPDGHFFLAPRASEVRSKVKFGDKESDFVVCNGDGNYELIELERHTPRILKKSDGEPTAEYNHARQQILDWLRFVADNPQYVDNELGLPGMRRPRGRVIMGRSKDISGEAANRRWKQMKEAQDIVPQTFDELLQESLSFLDNVKKLESWG